MPRSLYSELLAESGSALLDSLVAHLVRAAYSTIVATANPVPPFGCDGLAVDTEAGPAMSTCTHGVSLANVFRNSPAVIAPPKRSPVLRMSATLLLSCSRRRLLSGSRHMSSPVFSATAIQLFSSDSFSDITPAVYGPSATMH